MRDENQLPEFPIVLSDYTVNKQRKKSQIFETFF